MASRRQRRLQKKGIAQRRFLQRSQPMARISTHIEIPKAFLSKEPAILAEDIGKLVDIGVDPKTVDRISKAGFRGVREFVQKGREKIREIYGMKSRLPELEDRLKTQGVVLPA